MIDLGIGNPAFMQPYWDEYYRAIPVDAQRLLTRGRREGSERTHNDGVPIVSERSAWDGNFKPTDTYMVL